MIGLLIIAHTPLASALVACAQHVFGAAPELCMALDIEAEADPSAMLVQAKVLHEQLDVAKHGVLVMSDLFGATPCNIAAQLPRPGRTNVLSGVNLPMLMRALTYRNSLSLDALTEKACTGGSAGVMKLASKAQQNQRANFLDANTGFSQKSSVNNDPDNNPNNLDSNAHTRLQHQQ